MRTRTIVVLILFAVLLGCHSSNANSDLRLSLSTYGVEEVDVLEIPANVSTPVDYTADKLEHGYHAKLELRGGALLDHLSDLDRALARTECKNPGRAGDLRTAVIFFGTGHKKIRAFYYDLRGRGGQIDETPCELGPGLYEWVRSNLPD